MNSWRIRLIKSLSLILLFGTLSLVNSTCVFLPAPHLEVENQTDQVLTIYVHGDLVDDVAPGKKLKGHNVDTMGCTEFFIEGVNVQGEIVYSRIFLSEDLRRTDWRVIIPPSEETPYFPLEIVNDTGKFLHIYVDYALIGGLEPGARLKKRPLSSEYDTYHIEADSLYESAFYSKTLTRSELEKMDWKLVIGYPHKDNEKES